MCRYFQKLNIPRGPTPLPIFGNVFGFLRKGVAKYDEEVFDKYGSDIIGYFEATTPNVLCKDVDMIRHVMVKDFAYFVNRRVIEFLKIYSLLYF